MSCALLREPSRVGSAQCSISLNPCDLARAWADAFPGAEYPDLFQFSGERRAWWSHETASAFSGASSLCEGGEPEMLCILSSASIWQAPVTTSENTASLSNRYRCHEGAPVIVRI
jgi:hypothetical protein